MTAIVVVDEVSSELRSTVAVFLGRVRDRDVARRIGLSRWRPADEKTSGVSLHASTALLPLCREAGGYGHLRDKIVATILCDVVEIVPAADLAMVVDDFERHLENCLDDLRSKGYPTSRSVAGEYLCPEGSDRQLPLATLELSDTAIRRLSAFDPTLPIRWFRKLYALRAIFGGDESIVEFLAGLLIGIATTDPGEGARCIDLLLDHVASVMADADDAVLLSEHLISAAFQLPPVEPVRRSVGRLALIANDDATLLQIARAATGDWRSWLEAFCEDERTTDRPGRIARARTLQAMAGFPAGAVSEAFAPNHVERHAGRIEDDRRTAEAAARDWVTAAPDAREALEIRFLESATGQVLDLPDLSACGEIGALFQARIRVHEVQQIIDRTGSLFGLPGPPTRFLASNDKSRVLRARANRHRRFAEREGW